MVIWDLDEKHLFPSGAVMAYVKNILHFSRSPARVDALVMSMAGYYVLSAWLPDGRRVELLAPIACRRRIGEMYIPFVLQRSFGREEIHWSPDGRKTKGCAKIGEQPDGREFRLVTSRQGFLRFARSGKPRGFGVDATKVYAEQVRSYIEREFSQDYMNDRFRFVSVWGEEMVVPYAPAVLNHSEPEEFSNARERPLSANERLAIARF